VISFRCNEILHDVHENKYGFLNFHVYLLLIPMGVQYIYILTEPLNYNGGKNNEACATILAALIALFHLHHQHATVAVLRGHQFEAMIMLKETKLAISTASTFSFYLGP